MTLSAAREVVAALGVLPVSLGPRTSGKGGLAVEPALVLEVAFDAVHPSARHKWGLAVRFPHIHRIRWDKPAAEAHLLDTLHARVGA